MSGAVEEGQAARRQSAGPLRQIADGMSEDLRHWLRRSEAIFQHCQDLATREDELRHREVAFQEERRQWEARRQQEVAHIEESTKHLTDAWRRLEEEQRNLLRMRESAQRRPRDDGEGPSKRGSYRVQVTGPPEAEREAGAAAHSEPARTPLSRELAARQFEQLRQEIRMQTTS